MKNYLLIEYNSNYYLSIGPIFGYINQNGNIYIKLTNIDEINVYINGINNLSYKAFANYLLNNESFIYGESLYIDNSLYQFIFPRLDDDIKEALQIGIIDKDNITYIDNYNYQYYILLNNFNNIDINNINDLSKSFSNLILQLSDIDNIDFSINSDNNAYKVVLEYFANGKSDSTSNNLSLILNNKISISTNTYTSCGCNINQETSVNQSSISCYDTYIISLYNILKKMLGDTNFYNNWFFIKDGDKYIVNTILIEKLIELLNKFKELYLSQLSILSNNNHCECPSLDNSLSQYEKIIDNYIKVLTYILNCEINENNNKIKIYGEEFGDLLPNLYVQI